MLLHSHCIFHLFINRPRFGGISGRNGPPPMKFGNPGERLRKKKWNLDELPKFEKNFYTEHPEVQRMSQVIPHVLSIYAYAHRSKHLANFDMPRGCNSITVFVTSPVIAPCVCGLTLILFSCFMFKCPVWDGRVSEKEGDHYKRHWVSEGDYGFSPGTISSSVSSNMALFSFICFLPLSSFHIMHNVKGSYVVVYLVGVTVE